VNDAAQIIAASATLLGVAGGLILQAWSLRASLRNGKAIAEVHAATNGMSKRLEDAAEAKGVLQGRAESHKGDT
jgi:hypothetical protein